MQTQGKTTQVPPHHGQPRPPPLVRKTLRLRLRILPCLRLRSTCERLLHLHLRLHLRRKCEPSLSERYI